MFFCYMQFELVLESLYLLFEKKMALSNLKKKKINLDCLGMISKVEMLEKLLELD